MDGRAKEVQDFLLFVTIVKPKINADFFELPNMMNLGHVHNAM